MLKNAQNSLERLKNVVLELKSAGASPAPMVDHPLRKEFLESLYDNLNTAQALAVVWEAVGDKALSAAQRLGLLYDFDQVLGLGMEGWSKTIVEIPAAVQSLLEQRDLARKGKNWTESDRLRDEIKNLGFMVKDSAGGQTVTKL